MSHFDTLKDDIMDSIFAECYESLYLDILELETTIELLKLKFNEWGLTPFISYEFILLSKNFINLDNNYCFCIFN